MKIVLKILRLPLDFVVLSLHWLKACVWLTIFTIKEMFDLPVEDNWPFGNFEEKTESGNYVCLPAKKYGNPELFKLVCPDLVNDPCEGCICAMKLHENSERWRPSTFRIISMGMLLSCVWLGLFICAYPVADRYFLNDIKGRIKHIASTWRADNKVIAEKRVNEEDRIKAVDFLSKAKSFAEENKFSEALLDYQNAIKFDSENAEIYLGYGESLLSLQRYDEALAAFNRAIELEPSAWQTHIQVGKIFIAKRDWPKVKHHADIITKLNSEAAFAYLMRGLFFANQKRPEESLRELKTGVGLSFKDTYSYSLAAAMFKQLDDLINAEYCFKKALELDSKSIGARLGLAEIFRVQSQYDLATEHLNAILAEDPTNRDARIGLAEILASRRELLPAIKAYEELTNEFADDIDLRLRLTDLYVLTNQLTRAYKIVQKIKSDWPHQVTANLFLAEIYLKRNMPAAAEEALDIVLSQVPQHVDAQKMLIKAYLDQEQYEESFSKLLALHEQDPKDIYVLITLGKVYEKTGKTSNAIEVYRDTIELYPESRIPYLRLGVIYQEQNNYDLAIKNYREVIARGENAPIATNNLAGLLVRDSETIEEAYSLALKNRESYPKNPYFSDTLAWVYYHKSEHAKAEKLCEEVIKHLPNNALAHYHYGKVLYALNKYESAKSMLEKALSLSVDFDGKADSEMILSDISDK